jgi:hypothetical protein
MGQAFSEKLASLNTAAVGGRRRKGPRTPLVCVIGDRSVVGRKALDLWRTRFADVGDQMSTWRETEFGFFANLRIGDGGESIASLMARDESALFKDLLPELVSATRSRNGACTHLLGVEPGLRYKLEQAFAFHDAAARNEVVTVGLGYELFATGVLEGLRLVHAKQRTHERLVTVMALDRSAKGLGAIARLRQNGHQSWGLLDEWERGATSSFAVVVAEPSRSHVLYGADTVCGLLRQALPEALGPYIAAQIPVLLAMALDIGLLGLIGESLSMLEGGTLPTASAFPLAPEASGKSVPFRGLKIEDPLALQQVLSLTSYGSGASSLGHEPLFAGHQQRGARALRQADGALHYLLDLENGDCLGTVIPAGGWRVLSDEAADAIRGRNYRHPFQLQ